MPAAGMHAECRTFARRDIISGSGRAADVDRHHATEFPAIPPSRRRLRRGDARIRPARRDDRAAKPRPADRSRRRHRARHRRERACRKASRADEPRHRRRDPARPRDAEGPGERHLHLPSVHLGRARPLRQRRLPQGPGPAAAHDRAQSLRALQPGRHGPGPFPHRARPHGTRSGPERRGQCQAVRRHRRRGSEGRRLAHVADRRASSPSIARDPWSSPS